MFGTLKAFRRDRSTPQAVQPPAPPSVRPQARQGGWLQRQEAIMGTAISVELWADDPAQGEAAIDDVMAEMHRIDHAMSPHRPDSELSRINRDAHAAPVRLSAEMQRLIARALVFSALSGGAFDISYAAVGHLFDYREGVRPTEADLAQARRAVGWRHLLLDEQQGTLRFARPGMRIDLGGFAKGHAVDQATAILRARGIAHAHIAAGGDSRVIGDHRGRPWHIGIRDPRRPGEMVAVMPLVDAAISTSGDYERFFEADGQRFHHLIDPSTGRSPHGVHSVTILADDGLTTEALSKSVFVLGLDKGMALVNAQHGVDAVVVDAFGVLHFSAGLMAPAANTPAAALG
jgi:thiamine biosynthesis lipoprotein